MVEISSEVKQASSATSYNDYKAQDTKDVGKAPVQRELTKDVKEKSIDELIGAFQATSPAVTLDANVQAKQLTSLDGLPE